MAPYQHRQALSDVFRKQTRVGVLAFTMLTLFSVILAACGGGTPQQNNTGTAKGPVTLNILASPNGTFTAANFNPFLNSGATLSGAQGMIYETLLFTNRADGTIKPWLASSYTLAPDAKSITFTIRQGVQWSDGTPFTADDVHFTFDMLKQFPALDLQGLWTTLIKDVSYPDANTVHIDFQQANSTATWTFSQQYIASRKHWSTVSDPTTFADPTPVGTGPYVVKSYSPAVYVLAKNPHFWQAGLPKIDQLRYISTNDNTAAQLMISKGQVDWAGVGWDPKYDDQFVNKDPQHFHEWFPGTNTVMLYLNLTKAPFSDLSVRKALSLAIDRNQIHQTAAVYANPANPSGILPSNKDYIAPQYQSAQFTQDLNQAAQLLQQAGYTKDSNGIYAKGGKEISFNMIVPNGWNDWVASLQVISSNLKQLGVDAKVSALATPALYTQALNSGQYDAAISWTNAGPTPYFFLSGMLLSTNSWDKGKTATGTNWEHWKDPATDKLINQYLASADPTVQKQAIAGLEDILVNQLPSIPLDYNVGWFEYTTLHVTGWPDKDNPYDYGSPFNYPDNEYIVLQLTPVQ